MATCPSTASTPVIELAVAVVCLLRSAQLPGFEISQRVLPTGSGGAPRLARDSTVTGMLDLPPDQPLLEAEMTDTVVQQQQIVLVGAGAWRVGAA